MEPSEAYANMLAWLEGKKFDRQKALAEAVASEDAGGGRRLVALDDVGHQAVILDIPSSALLNAVTLAPLYPPVILSSLSAIQLITLHVTLYRHATIVSDTDSTQETFVPYLQTLPHDFVTVPLHREVLNPSNDWEEVYETIPYGLKLCVDDVSERFHKDWQRVCEVWEQHQPPNLPQLQDYYSLTLPNFVWAWLCVNSRCIYHDLGLSRVDNLTLAPIIDMANHVCNQKTQMVYSPRSLSLYASDPNDYHDLSDSEDSGSSLIKKGEEIFLSYGAHPDDTLLSEYGFVLGMPANKDASVNISGRIGVLFEGLEEKELQAKKEILQAHSYWGDYHLTLEDGSHPALSFRVLVALALLHLPLIPNDVPRPQSPRKRARIPQKESGSQEELLKPFYALINGETDRVSEENERKSHESIRDICRDILSDSVDALVKLSQLSKEGDAMIEMIKTAWTGETWFAQGMLERFKNHSRA